MTANSIEITEQQLLALWNGDGGLIETLSNVYRAGADAQLEKCCEYIGCEGSWFANPEHRLAELRAAMRPKPPSLKEQALKAFERVDMLWATDEFGKETLDDLDVLRRALESLPE